MIPTVRNDFKVLAFDGNEAISALYSIRVDLVSEYPDIDLESLLSQPAFLQFGLNGEGIHGHIEDVSVGEVGKRLTRYQLKLVPALHYLQFSHDQRIFQRRRCRKSSRRCSRGMAFRLMPSPSMSHRVPPREYCTQYAGKRF